MDKDIELGGWSREDEELLQRWAGGLGKTIETLTGEYIGEISRRQNEIRRRLVTATVTDLALMRARKRPWKVTNS